jgi:hypothetical protein
LIYDAASRIINTADTNPVYNRTYDYDALNRLTSQSDNTSFILWVYDHYFTHGFDVELFNILQAKFGHAAVQAYLTKRQTSSGAFKAELSNINLLRDEACWNQFIADKKTILANAIDLLNFYHGWWLLGIGKEKSEPDKRVEEFGILDHIDNTTLSEWNKFDASYPAISFALSFIIQHHINPEIIQKIALTNLEDVPDMWGKDLWLQRRAMIACVKRSGPSFIVDSPKPDQIRTDLLCFVKGRCQSH